jgi:transposase
MTNRLGDVSLTQVVKVYLAAGKKGLPPTKAVRERFGISQSTAGAWIMKARAENLLPPTYQGNPGCRNLRAMRVSKALGVEYDDLVNAVIRHAAGRLILQ